VKLNEGGQTSNKRASEFDPKSSDSVMNSVGGSTGGSCQRREIFLVIEWKRRKDLAVRETEVDVRHFFDGLCEINMAER